MAHLLARFLTARHTGPTHALLLFTATLVLSSGVLLGLPAALAMSNPLGSRATALELPDTIEMAWDGAAPCTLPAGELDASVAAGLATLARYADPVSRRVHSVSFRGQPRLLVDGFTVLTSKATAAQLAAAAGCADVPCAVRRIFGEVEGPRLLYLLVRYRYNASHLADASARPWPAEDLADILLALSDLPPATVPFSQLPIRPLVREARYDRIRDLYPGPPETIIAINVPAAREGIRAAGMWDSLPPPARRAAIFHEVAHDFFRVQIRRSDAQRTWARAMRADALLALAQGRDSGAVSAYAGQSPEEDFAESAAAYRYLPQLIAERAPNRARLLRAWYFDGLSYQTDAQCDPERSRSQMASRAAVEGLPTYRMPDAAVLGAVDECAARLADDASRTRVTHGRLCIAKAIYRASFASQLAAAGPPADPTLAALLRDRAANEPFLEEQVGRLDDHEVMAITDRRSTAACGGACHPGGLVVRPL
jgi:hypothetical protein